LHPDKNRDDENATANFQLINTAYKVLSDPEKRKTYDTTGKQLIISEYNFCIVMIYRVFWR
jgi:DnaJ-class molecular chaperone